MYNSGMRKRLTIAPVRERIVAPLVEASRNRSKRCAEAMTLRLLSRYGWYGVMSSGVDKLRMLKILRALRRRVHRSEHSCATDPRAAHAPCCCGEAINSCRGCRFSDDGSSDKRYAIGPFGSNGSDFYICCKFVGFPA